jgi:signal peptidase I
MGTGSRRVSSFAATTAVGLVLMVLLRALVAQSFFVPTASMAPTVEPGDRVLVNKLADRAGLHRGDVIVFDGTSTFAAADRSPRSSTGAIGRALGSVATAMGIQLGEQDFLKRILGLPGDRVVCCDAGGRLSVNGVSVAEHYLPRDAKASDEPFDVLVPPGRLWVMGDNRPVSADSRAHLGDPGGGMVLIDDVIGRASVIYWPLARAGGLPGSGPLRSVPSPTGGGS